MKILKKLLVVQFLLLASQIMAQDGAWFPLDSGVNGTIWAIAVSGTDVYVGGTFTTAGGVSAKRIAKWDGTSWSALGTGLNNTVFCITVSGNDVYVGGGFTNAGGVSANRIAKWDGTSWTSLGTGCDNFVQSIAVNGNTVYAGGTFTQAGGVFANKIARWNGTSWSAMGMGLNGDVESVINVGNDIYVGGFFTASGGTTLNRIAKWSGSWSALGTGMNNNVYTLYAEGNDIYAGGVFTQAGGTGAKRMAKWDGSSWSALGDGFNPPSSYVRDISGNGSEIFAGGQFVESNGDTSKNLAKWNGSGWSALGDGIDGLRVNGVAYLNNNLYAGGNITEAGGNPVNNIAVFIYVPPAPGNLSLNIPSQGTVELNWADTLSNEDGFVIERKLNLDTSWTVMDTTGINVTSFLDSGLTVGNTYSYRVYAFNVSGNSGYSDTVSTVITAVTGIQNTPEKFALYNNYPNPFNPTTKIKFDRPKNGIVKLTVYDIHGREVRNLVNNELTPGSYEVEWNAGGYASGMYFYRIETEGFVETKKMMLVK